MARHTRQKKENNEVKRKIRKEQVKLAMRRHRQKMTQEQLEERRRKDRERYRQKKEQGLIKSISELTPRAQRTVRKLWQERSKKYRDKKRQMEEINQQTVEFMNNETPPDSPKASSSQSRAETGKKIAERNRKRLKLENTLLKEKLRIMENRVKKYKMRFNRAINKINTQNIKVVNNIKKSKIDNTKKLIQEFLEKDECSRLTAGKKETITRKKNKKQIRLLNDSLLSLYSKFKNSVNNKISYSLFCRYRPFWILSPTTRQRDTCLCIHHANMELLTTALKTAKLINESTPVALVKTICCEGKLREECLLRKCKECQKKKLQFNEFINNDSVGYFRWVTKKYPVSIKGSEKMCQKTIKEKILSSKKDLITILYSKLPGFMKHLNSIYHQYQAINSVKRQIDEETALLHIDFAENYICKYAEEVQAVHFGASKPQISLHTAVLYHFGEFDSTITPFCTVSKNLRHDPVFICNHLLPIINIIKNLHPNLKTMHFVSDGPSSQYRNKSMFFLMANFLAVKLNVQNLIWHYNEAGHGKGSPDGIGAIVKRTADQSVARGNDVASYEQLIQCLNENCKSVQILSVDEENVTEIEELMSTSLTPTFKGTMDIHQVTWSKNNSSLLHARKLSCFDCQPHQICSHYEIGVINTEPAQSLSGRDISSSLFNIEAENITEEAHCSSTPPTPPSGCPASDIDISSPDCRSPAPIPTPQQIFNNAIDSDCDSSIFRTNHQSPQNNSFAASDDDNPTWLDDLDDENQAVTVLSKRSQKFYYISHSSDDSFDRELRRKNFIEKTMNANTSSFKKKIITKKRRMRIESSSSSENLF